MSVALVTGASRGGTGTAIAVRLAAEGYDVAVTARGKEGLEETVARMGGGLAIPCDLVDPGGGRDRIVPQVEAELGPISVLVNNAAAGGYRPFESWTDAQLRAMQEVNVWAPWLLMRQAVPGMRERGSGAVLNLTSFSAELPPGPPFPRNKPATEGSAYGSTKAALNRLTVSAASETHGQGVVVNALAPQAAIATPDLVAAGWVDPDYMEPLETMAEAALALLSGSLTGRICYSLELLVQLDQPVRDLGGKELVEGWQPADLPAVIAGHAARLESAGWPAPFGGTGGRIRRQD